MTQLYIPGLEPEEILEEQNSMLSVLAEARKHNFGLIAAKQFPKKLSSSFTQAFYKNTSKVIINNLPI